MKTNISIFAIIIIIISFLPITLFAQELTDTIEVPIPVSSVHILGERSLNSIALRWAPSDARLWHMCNKTGYTISRVELDKSAKKLSDSFQELASVSPLSQQEWEAYLIANDLPDYPSVGMECIYGEFASLALGKSPTAVFAQANELSNKFSFALYAADMDQKTAEMSGLFYRDNDIKKDAIYVYKVTPIIPDGINIDFSNGAILMSTDTTAYPPIMLEGTESEGRIELRWTRSTYEQHYTAYVIERSVDNKNFESLEDKPYIHGVSGDSTLISPFISYLDKVENYKTYYYRIIGLTPFGNRGPVTSGLKAMARDRTPPSIPTQLKTEFMGDAAVKLKWDYEPTEPITGFNIYRGHAYEDNYYPLNENLIPASARSFTDNAALVNDRNYYYVTAIDTAGNRASSHIAFGELIDTIPPPVPTGLSAKVDSNGIVSLQWKPSIAPDILGYKIFYANADYHEFSLLTGQAIPYSGYVDSISLNTLTRHAYYKVMAVDNHYNYSELSEILKVERPDILPPTSPIFTDYKVEKDFIALEWAPSHSNDLDKHQLWKKENTASWTLVTETDMITTSYVDSKIEAGATYQYKIIAIDQAGLKSDVAFVIYLETGENLLVEGIQKISLSLNDKNQAELIWEYPTDKNHDLVIYRSTPRSGFQVLKILDSTKEKYVDQSVAIGGIYKYTMKARFENGGQSKFSEVKEIKIE